MPVSGLASLPTLLGGSNIDLEVRSPPLALQELYDQFLDTLARVTNLIGLDLTTWSLPPPEKLQRLTHLEQFSVFCYDMDLEALSRLTKLSVDETTPSQEVWHSLTSLHDLSIRQIPSQDFLKTVLPTLTALTRLHFGFHYASYNFGNAVTVCLTALSNLKDLKISTNHYTAPTIDLTASTTSLESLWINDRVQQVDIKWVASNTNLTTFQLRCAYDDSPTFHPLTNLRNLSKAYFTNRSQLDLFRNAKLKSLQVEMMQYEHISSKLSHCSALESLIGVHSFPQSTLVNLTHLSVQGINTSNPASLPTTLRVLEGNGIVLNLHQLTRLESIQYGQQLVESMNKFDAKNFSHLTKISVVYNDISEAQATLPKLSNLFSLRNLEIFTAQTYQNINTDFLTTLTNLERLDMKWIPQSKQIYKKIVRCLTALSQLCISCESATGKSLTRLTNLQQIWFSCAKPSSQLKAILEGRLSRLGELQIISTMSLKLMGHMDSSWLMPRSELTK